MDASPTTESTTATIRQKHRKLRSVIIPVSSLVLENRTSISEDGHTMDLSTDKIVVLDLEEQRPGGTSGSLASQVSIYNTFELS